jgi:hypothetical protein
MVGMSKILSKETKEWNLKVFSSKGLGARHNLARRNLIEEACANIVLIILDVEANLHITMGGPNKMCQLHVKIVLQDFLLKNKRGSGFVRQ